MGQRVAAVGFGQTYQRSIRKDVNGRELINEAVVAALQDANLTVKDIDAFIVGNMDHFEGINSVETWAVDAFCGAGKPVIKLTTGGTTGSTIGIAAYYMVASGLFNKVMAIGWEKNSESDTTGAIITAFDPVWERKTLAGAVGGLALEAAVYMQYRGGTPKDAARVAVRERKHALNNPYAQLHYEWLRDLDYKTAVELVVNSAENAMLADPVRMSDMCPRTDGAAALIFAAEGYAEKITPTPAWVAAVSVRHDYTYIGDANYRENTTVRDASREVFDKVGITEPLKEVDVCELYIPYSYAFLKWFEDMGFCPRGHCARLVWDGVTDMGGELPCNPSGGVMSSNAIGATGLIRQGEAAWQIMGKCGPRQVPDVKVAFATGFGGCFWADVMLLTRNKPD